MTTTKEKIDAYMDAYHEYIGIYPTIERNGAWLRINNAPYSIRVKDLVIMTNKLLREIESKKKIWDDCVTKEIVDAFLERLFIECKNSAFEMKECLENFTIDGELTKGLNPLWGNNPDPNCEGHDCDIVNDLKNEIEDLKEDLFRLKHKEKNQTEKCSILKKEMALLKIDMNKLRSESVLFSMDDLIIEGHSRNNHDDYDRDYDDYDDDDIPF
jgi:hypothetical protein